MCKKEEEASLSFVQTLSCESGLEVRPADHQRLSLCTTHLAETANWDSFWE